ncbi:VanZ family protein [Lewinella sp. IMCC34183]|uniref:VanZ family protein n=1 Tax=Lewinella sp. IMCC34183 TaxID=2248762 RepID=UPI000E2304CA
MDRKDRAERPRRPGRPAGRGGLHGINFLKNFPLPPKSPPAASYLRVRQYSRWITGAYTLLLVYVSLAPGQRIPTIFDWSKLISPDKIAHFGAYAFFAVLLSFSIGTASYRKRAATAALAAALFGVLMEFLQGIAGTGRDFDPVDMVANLIGALLGAALILLLRPLLTKYLAPAGS